MSRIIEILKGTYTDEPQSRNEAILLGEDLTPETRSEEYFKALYSKVPCTLIPQTREESIIDAITNGRIYSVISTDAFTTRTTAEGTDIIDGAKADIESIEGKTQSFNQLVNPENYVADFTRNNVTFTRLADNSIQAVVGEGGCTANVDFKVQYYGKDLNTTHKYLLKGSPNGGSTNTYRLILYSSSGNISDVGNGKIGSVNNLNNYTLYASFISGCPAGTYIFKPNVIDLSRNNDDTLTLEQAMAKYNNFYAYDSGSLKNSKVTSLTSKDSNGNVKDTLELNKELGSWHDIRKANNFFSGTNWAQGQAFWGADSEYNSCDDYIAVNPNTTYKYLQDVYISRYDVKYYDKDKNVIPPTALINVSTTFTTPNNCYFIKIETYVSGGSALPTKYLLTTDTTLTINDWLPYATTSHVEVEEYGEYTFTSSDSWNQIATNVSGKYRYEYRVLLGTIKNATDNYDLTRFICDSLTVIPAGGTGGTYGCYNGISESNIGYIQVYQDNIQSVADMTEFMTGKKIRYQKANPTYTPLNLGSSYNAYNQGSETIESDTAQYGAIATTEIKYMYSESPLVEYQSELEQTLVEEAARWTN